MMDTKFWRQGQPQSREVSQAEIDRAAGLNYINAGPALSAGMKRAGLGTDAANQMVWAQKQAEYDSARRPGVVQIGTDGNATSFADPGLSAMEIDRAAVANAVSSNPSLSRFWDPPEVRAQRMAEQRQQRQAEQAPVNARGVAGATFGTVNGKQMLVPEAGRYGEFRGAMSQLGLDGTMGVDRGQFEQARHNLVTAQERGRRGEKFEARKTAKQQFEQQKELAGLKTYGRGVGKSGDTVDEAGQKAGQRAFYKDRSDWIELQNLGREFQGLYDSAKARGMDDNDVVTVNGKEVYVGDLASMSKSYLAAPEPRWEQYGQTPAAASTPGAGGLTDQDKAEMDRLSGPALDRAIQRAEQEGWTDDLAYLRQRKARAGRVAGR